MAAEVLWDIEKKGGGVEEEKGKKKKKEREREREREEDGCGEVMGREGRMGEK